MLETLKEALSFLYSTGGEEANNMIKLIEEYVDAIDEACIEDTSEFTVIASEFKKKLPEYTNDNVKKYINLYYEKMVECIKKLPRQYKVVFLPNYENTWDSLKSVYETFLGDSQFVTEIVIIPIYRNTPSGNVFVYDDYLTPIGIKNTHYEQYSFELDKPDIVFYNNPYDGVNLPKFTSMHIKRHVGTMIYIPYYLEAPRYIEKRSLESLAQTIMGLSGHDNADVIVAASDWDVNVIQTHNSKKRIPLGNPKTDFFLATEKSGLGDVPEWQGKELSGYTFMLNTHYSVAVDSDEIYLHITEHILQFIEKNQNCSLIWRPHPQTFFMLNNRTDQLANRFFTLINKAKNSKRIIFDTSGSAVNAYMYSDALISTSWSSTILEALFFDMPVCVSTQNILTRKDVNIINDTAENKKDILFREDVVIQPQFAAHSIYDWDEVIIEFMQDVMEGRDKKREKRKSFIKHALKNGDGSCANNILKYVKELIKE